MTQDTLLRLSQVEEAAGLKKSTIYSMMERNEFPRPVRIGSRTVRWRSSDLAEWIAERETA